MTDDDTRARAEAQTRKRHQIALICELMEDLDLTADALVYDVLDWGTAELLARLPLDDLQKALTVLQQDARERGLSSGQDT